MTGSGGDLYVINSDGTNLRHLASGVIDPVVSPDGRQVAFTRWDGAEFGTLYALNLDGSAERVILGETRQAKSPAWSPDGQEIIVSFQHGGLRDPSPECRTFDVDDGFQLPGDIEITKTHVGVNGVTVCFVRLEDLQWGLRRVNVADGKFEDLPADTYTYNPAWDPANPWRVIYDGDKGLVQLDLNNGSRQSLTTDLRDTGPVFSSDGTKLALTYKQHDHWEVYTYDLQTGARQRLTKPPILADPQYNSAAPAWSPDGSQLAFVTDRSGKWEIWVMNADGSNQRPLFAPEVQAQLSLEYHGVNERMLNWIK
jgi:Tol biopolymer transport system component